MSCHCHCDCQENIDDDDEATVTAMVTEKPIKDGLLITTMAAMSVGIFFGLRTIGVAQHDALLTSMTWAWLMSFPYQKRYDDNQTLYNKMSSFD